MSDPTDRQTDLESRASANWSFWSWFLAVGVPALLYFGVVINHNDNRHYLYGDSQYYFYTAVSLLEDHDVDLINNLPPPLRRHSMDVSLDQGGRLVPKHPMWMAVFAAPLIAAFGAPGALIFNLLQLVLLLYLIALFTGRYATARGSSLAIALTGVISIFPYYAWNFSADIFSCLLLVAGLVALPADRSPNLLRHILAGGLLGLAVVSKFPLVLAIAGLPLLCGRPYRKSLPALALGMAVPVALFLTLNLHLFGSHFTTSYDCMAEIEDDVILAVHSQRSDFGRPVLSRARDMVMDRTHGLLFTSPITLLSLMGLYPLARRDIWTASYLFGTFLSLFLFFSMYRYWHTSYYGNRFLIPILVLAAVPLATLLDKTIFRRIPPEKGTKVNKPTTSSRIGP